MSIGIGVPQATTALYGCLERIIKAMYASLTRPSKARPLSPSHFSKLSHYFSTVTLELWGQTPSIFSRSVIASIDRLIIVAILGFPSGNFVAVSLPFGDPVAQDFINNLLLARARIFYALKIFEWSTLPDCPCGVYRSVRLIRVGRPLTSPAAPSRCSGSWEGGWIAGARRLLMDALHLSPEKAGGRELIPFRSRDAPGCAWRFNTSCTRCIIKIGGGQRDFA